MRLRDGLLKSLAGPVVFYSLPAGRMPEAPMGGAVAMLKLSDPALFEKTMTTLGAFVGEKAEGMLQVGSQTDEDGRTIHLWASPALAFAQVMPTWSVVGDQAVIGSNTALCTMGIQRVASRGDGKRSLADSDSYKKATADLPKNLLSLSYVDSQAQFTQMMMQLQQVWPLATMGAMKAGIKLPVMLPNLGAIVKDMQPACEYSYARADGFYSHYRGTGLEVSLRGAAGGALAAGVLMPALARARQTARRVSTMDDLKQMGLALFMHAQDRDGRFADALEDIESYLASPSVLRSPRKPDDFDGPSYIYIAGQTMTMSPGNVLVYENPEFCDDRINVLFLDGHVESMTEKAFVEALEATYERLDRRAPEVRFGGQR
jgi:prepilin-type processing-associated H-X9-DG protein